LDEEGAELIEGLRGLQRSVPTPTSSNKEGGKASQRCGRWSANEVAALQEGARSLHLPGV